MKISKRIYYSLINFNWNIIPIILFYALCVGITISFPYIIYLWLTCQI